MDFSRIRVASKVSLHENRLKALKCRWENGKIRKNGKWAPIGGRSLTRWEHWRARRWIAITAKCKLPRELWCSLRTGSTCHYCLLARTLAVFLSFSLVHNIILRITARPYTLNNNPTLFPSKVSFSSER